MKKSIKAIKQNSKLIIKHIPKDIFETHNVIKHNITLSKDLLKLISNLDKKVVTKIKDTFADEYVYTCELSIGKNCIFFNFRRTDWRGDEDCPTRIKVVFTDMNKQFLNYTYDTLLKFINENIDTIFKSVEKKKKKKKIEKFKLKNVA